MAALPVKLDFDAVVTVGVDGAVVADDNGGLLTMDGGLGVEACAVVVFGLRAVGDGVGDEGQSVAVARLFAVVSAVLPLVGDEVIVGLVVDAGDEEGGGLTVIGVDRRVSRIVLQRNEAAGGGGADCACGVDIMTTGVYGVHSDAGIAFTLTAVAVVVGILTGGIVMGDGTAKVFAIGLGAGAGVVIAAVVDLVGTVVPGDGLDAMRG